MDGADRTCTLLLQELAGGREGARQELFELVYGELRRIAAQQMRAQAAHHTLQPTALVHEAFFKLMGTGNTSWNDRAHVLRTAARAMRSILVDHARAKLAVKRGGGAPAPLSLDLDGPAREGPPLAEVVLVHEALDRLRDVDERRAQVVELRYFGGLSFAEAARVMGLSVGSVHGAWEHARLWLAREIAG